MCSSERSLNLPGGIRAILSAIVKLGNGEYILENMADSTNLLAN